MATLLIRLRALVEIQTSLAQLDGLTGILNRRAFKARYEMFAKLAARRPQPIALGYLDVDGFKGVNDTQGHRVGDQVLTAVANTITERLRTSDVVARMGGDEFAILLPDVGVGGTTRLISEIRESLLALASRNHWPIGYSIGVVVFQVPPASAEEAISYADRLMYTTHYPRHPSRLLRHTGER